MDGAGAPRRPVTLGNADVRATAIVPGTRVGHCSDTAGVGVRPMAQKVGTTGTPAGQAPREGLAHHPVQAAQPTAPEDSGAHTLPPSRG